MRLIKSFLLGFITVFLFTSLQAQRPRAGLHVGFALVQPGQSNINQGWSSSLGVDFSLSKKLRVAFDFAYGTHQVDYDPEGLFGGTMTLTPFWGTAQYFFLPDLKPSPYVFAGIGYIFSSFRLGELNKLPELEISQELKNGWGAHAGLGLEVKVKERFAFYLEGLYALRQTNCVTTLNDMNLGISKETFSVDLNSWQIRLGLRYFY